MRDRSAILKTKGLTVHPQIALPHVSAKTPGEFQLCLLGTRCGAASYCPLSTGTKVQLVPLLRVVPRCELVKLHSKVELASLNSQIKMLCIKVVI